MSVARTRQRGTAAIELAAAISAFTLLALGSLEIGHALYVWNGMQEALRRVARAASTSDFNGSALAAAKTSALLFDSHGRSAFGASFTTSMIQVKYLTRDFADATIPASAAANIATCHATPDSSACVRFVQVRLCQAGTDCTALQFTPVLPLLPPMDIPAMTMILPAQSLGCTAAPCT